MPLSDIVNVQITRQTQSVSEIGFGTPMILGAFKNWTDLIRQYSNMQGVALDFSPNQPEYVAAQDVFSQAITVSSLFIGRRTVDTVDVSVETAQSGITYTTTINGTPVSITTPTAIQQSTVTLSGSVTIVTTFSGSFTSSLSEFIGTINGVSTANVPWDTNDATTLSDMATAMTALGGNTTTSGSHSLTTVFTPSNSAIVNGFTITGSGQPTVTSIVQTVGPLITSNVATFSLNGVSQTPITFASSNTATMTAIATAIQTALNVGQTFPIATVTVGGPNENVLTVVSNPNQPGIINSFVVSSGASDATAVIVNTTQAVTNESIANQMATAIQNLTSSLFVTGADNGNGTYTVSANTTGVPYTMTVSSTIVQPNQCIVKITQDIPNQAYTIKINGTLFIYQSPNITSSVDQISLGLVAIINQLVNGSKLQPVTATDLGSGSLNIIADVPANSFNVQIFPKEAMSLEFGLIIGPYVPSANVVNDLTAIQAVNDSWYALACTDRTVSTVEAIAEWIETQIKIFGTASNDLNIINVSPGMDLTSIAYVFNNLGYVRSFVMYHQDALTDFPECAWFGNCLPLTPGSETWMFKQLASIAYSDLTTTQENNAFGKSANTYEYIGGVGITQMGTVGVGEYIDIVRGVDWLTSTIQSYVYSTLVNNPKVPYTDAGITAIQSQVQAALQLGESNNFIATEPPFQVFVPLAKNVPSVDKANRILRNVSFQATLAGAIQAVNITGTVSV